MGISLGRKTTMRPIGADGWLKFRALVLSGGRKKIEGASLTTGHVYCGTPEKRHEKDRPDLPLRPGWYITVTSDTGLRVTGRLQDHREIGGTVDVAVKLAGYLPKTRHDGTEYAQPVFVYQHTATEADRAAEQEARRAASAPKGGTGSSSGPSATDITIPAPTDRTAVLEVGKKVLKALNHGQQIEERIVEGWIECARLAIAHAGQVQFIPLEIMAAARDINDLRNKILGKLSRPKEELPENLKMEAPVAVPSYRPDPRPPIRPAAPPDPVPAAAPTAELLDIRDLTLSYHELHGSDASDNRNWPSSSDEIFSECEFYNDLGQCKYNIRSRSEVDLNIMRQFVLFARWLLHGEEAQVRQKIMSKYRGIEAGEITALTRDLKQALSTIEKAEQEIETEQRVRREMADDYHRVTGERVEENRLFRLAKVELNHGFKYFDRDLIERIARESLDDLLPSLAPYRKLATWLLQGNDDPTTARRVKMMFPNADETDLIFIPFCARQFLQVIAAAEREGILSPAPAAPAPGGRKRERPTGRWAGLRLKDVHKAASDEYWRLRMSPSARPDETLVMYLGWLATLGEADLRAEFNHQDDWTEAIITDGRPAQWRDGYLPYLRERLTT